MDEGKSGLLCHLLLEPEKSTFVLVSLCCTVFDEYFRLLPGQPRDGCDDPRLVIPGRRPFG